MADENKGRIYAELEQLRAENARLQAENQRLETDYNTTLEAFFSDSSGAVALRAGFLLIPLSARNFTV
jgi:cell division protein FtsB